MLVRTLEGMRGVCELIDSQNPRGSEEGIP